MYVADIYPGGEGRPRWAVSRTGSCEWYFADGYGRRAAEAYARRLNRFAK